MAGRRVRPYPVDRVVLTAAAIRWTVTHHEPWAMVVWQVTAGEGLQNLSGVRNLLHDERDAKRPATERSIETG
jgi:hypothetical protein